METWTRVITKKISEFEIVLAENMLFLKRKCIWPLVQEHQQLLCPLSGHYTCMEQNSIPAQQCYP